MMRRSSDSSAAADAACVGHHLCAASEPGSLAMSLSSPQQYSFQGHSPSVAAPPGPRRPESTEDPMTSPQSAPTDAPAPLITVDVWTDVV